MRQRIQDYLESHNICTIAVADGNTPHAHTMYYVSHGLHLYLDSEPTSQKVHILRANSKISLTVGEDYLDWRKLMGVEIHGRVNFIGEPNKPKLRKAFQTKFPHIKAFGGIPKHHTFLEVIPEVIYLIDFNEGFGHRNVHYPKHTTSEIDW